MKPLRYAPPTKWIRSEETGNTYLCPIDIRSDAPEKVLKKYCIDESDNPQNA